MLNKELKFLLKCLSHKTNGNHIEIDKDIDWAIFLDVVEQHELEPQLYERCKVLDLPLPSDVLSTLKKRSDSIGLQNLRHVQELVRLVKAFQRANIEVMPYKGVLLAQQIYGAVTKRKTKDIDIVVAKSDVKAAISILLQEGYIGGIDNNRLIQREDINTTLKNKNVLGFSHKKEFWFIELHWEWLSPCYTFQMGYVENKSKLAYQENFGIQYLAFQPRDLFLILCIHAAKHHYLRLKWLLDVAACLKQFSSLDAQDLCDYAEDHKARELVLRTLYLLHHLLDIPIPRHLLNEVEESRKQCILLKQVMGQFSSWPMPGLNEWQQVHYNLRLVDGLNLVYKWNYLRRIVFVGGQELYYRPRFLRPLYLLLFRPTRILWRMVLRQLHKPRYHPTNN